MTHAVRFDHVVVVVPALEEAIAGYRAAGFTVLPGGRHDVLPTENALVAFAGGGYIELIAFREAGTRDALRALAATGAWEEHLRGVSAVARRFLPNLAARAGVADVCFARERLARFAAESRRRGVVMTGPVAMERRRPDGAALAWELVLPADATLPFLIEDRTARGLRVPGETEAVTHANGARGISALRLRSASVIGTALAWADLFGATPRSERDGTTWLELAGMAIELTEGGPPGACEVTIAGVASLPAALLAEGLRPGP